MVDFFYLDDVNDRHRDVDVHGDVQIVHFVKTEGGYFLVVVVLVEAYEIYEYKCKAENLPSERGVYSCLRPTHQSNWMSGRILGDFRYHSLFYVDCKNLNRQTTFVQN